MPMEKIIEKLMTDKYFGIYNRNGFEYLLEEAYDNAKLYLLDFEDVGGMNKKLGYFEVNEIFKQMFSELKQKYLIGRAFSGDEIFFHTFDITDEIHTIKNVCDKYDLKFKYIECFYRNGSNVNEVLENMINRLHQLG